MCFNMMFNGIQFEYLQYGKRMTGQTDYVSNKIIENGVKDLCVEDTL